MDQCSIGTTSHQSYRWPHQPAGARSRTRNQPTLQDPRVLTGRRLGDQPPSAGVETRQRHADRVPL